MNGCTGRKLSWIISNLTVKERQVKTTCCRRGSSTEPGPDGFTTATGEMNFKVGGDWIFTMHGPDGPDYPNHIMYTQIKEPERITYDHYGYEDEEGDPSHFKTTIVFEDLGERTKIKMHMLFPTVEKRKEAAEFGAVEGGKQTLGRLAQYLEEDIRKS